MYRVVIVEDNDIIREGLMMLLNSNSMFECVASYSSCSSLMKEIESVNPEFILIDIGQNGISGVDGIRRIRTVSKDIHILVLTVYDENEFLFEAIRAGASGYVLKNSPPEKIIETLQDLVVGEAQMSGHIARKVLGIFENKRKRLSGYSKYSLTPNERKILRGLVEGNSVVAIAESLIMNAHGIRANFFNIYRKLQMYS